MSSVFSQFRWIVHSWCGRGLLSGPFGEAVKLGNLFTATGVINQIKNTQINTDIQRLTSTLALLLAHVSVGNLGHWYRESQWSCFNRGTVTVIYPPFLTQYNALLYSLYTLTVLYCICNNQGKSK